MQIADILRQVIISAVPVVLAITLHEAAHGYMALRLGDRTAQALGRISLNPIRHIDPFGTVVLPLMILVFSGGQFVFGYAKPVPINHWNFNNPRKGMALTAAAGPLSNIALAVLSVLLFKLALAMQGVLPAGMIEPLALMLKSSVYINVILASLNLMPVLPLDGGRVVHGFLPRDLALRFERVEPYGMFIVIILLVTGLAGYFIVPVARLLMAILSLI